MGTPDFALPALDALIAAGHDIAAVYTQPPRPSGRGHSLQPSPVAKRAEAHGIPVRWPVSLRDPAVQAEFAALDLDVAVVAAYGLILPKAVLAAPRHGCINIHGSLLPRWRGAAPVHRAILAGDAESGVCIMGMEAGLDTGPVYKAVSLPLGPETTGGMLHDALAAMGARALVECLPAIADGSLLPVVQPDDGVTYASKIERAESRLDWRLPAEQLERVVRAFAPAPGAYAEIGTERIKILAARIVDASGAPGEALDDRMTIACGDKALQPTRLQRPGKAAVALDDFLNGYRLPAGSRLPLPTDSEAA